MTRPAQEVKSLGYAYKLFGEGDVSALDTKPGRVELDKGLMTASAVFATSTRDRQGDILEIGGIQTAAHQFNPIVLWDHGRNWSVPVGKTKSVDGQYTVVCDRHLGEARQTTYFSQSDGVAAQIYRLIDEGIINANSFGFREIDIGRLPPDPAQNLKGGKHIRACDLLEVSWTPVPANPECVTELLSRGTVEGKNLAPCIKSLLQPYALPKKAWSGGVVLNGGVVVKKETKAAQSALDESAGGALRKSDDGSKKKDKDKEEAAAGHDDDPGDKPGGGQGEVADVEDTDADHQVGDTADTEGEGAPDVVDDEKAVEPPSASLMRDLHADMNRFHGVYSKEAQLIEHPQAKDHLSGVLERWGKEIEDLVGAFASIHSELDPLIYSDDAAAPQEGGESEVPEEEAAQEEELAEGADQTTEAASGQDVPTGEDEYPPKKSVTGGKTKSFTKSEQETITDVKDILEELSQNEGMSKTHRAALAHHIGRIKEMCARYQKAEVTPEEMAAAGGGGTAVAPEAVQKSASEETTKALNDEERAYLDQIARAVKRRQHMLAKIGGDGEEANGELN